jgi:hypothetical protein
MTQPIPASAPESIKCIIKLLTLAGYTGEAITYLECALVALTTDRAKQSIQIAQAKLQNTPQ